MQRQRPARSDESVAHVEEQVTPEQTPLTQSTSVPQVPPRLLRQRPVPPTIEYVSPAGQSHELVNPFQVDPAAVQVHELLFATEFDDPPPQAVQGLRPVPL